MSKRSRSSGPWDRFVDALSRLAGTGNRLFAAWRGYERRLARAETLIQDQDPGQAMALLAPMRRTVERMWGPCGPGCRARWHLAWGYCRGCAGSLDEAWISFRVARREADDVADDPLARELVLRAHVELATVALVTGTDRSLDVAVQHADEAVSRAAGVEDAYTLRRLVNCLVSVAQVEHQSGRWPAARGHYEAAVRTALRLPPPAAAAADPEARALRIWAEARGTGATAAIGLAGTLASLGDAAGAREWFDRGREVLEGPGHARTHLSRGVLSLERARCEADDDVGAPTRRISWMKEAVSEGQASGTPEGQELACRAGIELSGQLRGLGDGAGAVEQALRVVERSEALAPPLALVFGTEARLALGLARLDAGDEGGALAALREAVERGRCAVTSEARLFAAAAAWHLHVALIEDRKVVEAGRALETLEELAPTLADPQRPFFVALMAYLRGMTRLCEGRHDEAQAELERAETLARRLERADPDLVRSVVAGLGSVALEREGWAEAEAHFRRALAALPGDAPSARRQAARAELLLGMARAVAPTPRTDEALGLLRQAFATGTASGCSAGRKVAAHAALIEGDAPMLESGERRRLYETAARLGRVSGLAQGRVIAEQAETRLGDLMA